MWGTCCPATYQPGVLTSFGVLINAGKHRAIKYTLNINKRSGPYAENRVSHQCYIKCDNCKYTLKKSICQNICHARYYSNEPPPLRQTNWILPLSTRDSNICIFFLIYAIQSASIFQFSLDPKVTRITPALCEFAKIFFSSLLVCP